MASCRQPRRLLREERDSFGGKITSQVTFFLWGHENFIEAKILKKKSGWG